MAILTLLFTILFGFFSLGQIVRIDIAPGVAVTGLDLGVVLLVSVGSIYLTFAKQWKVPLFCKSLLIFLGVACLSLIVAAFFIPQLQSLVAGLYLFRFLMYASIAFIITSLTEKQKYLVQWFLFGSGMFIIISGYVQFFFYPALRNLYYGGWDEHFYRMFGTFLDPNFLGLFLVGFSLFLLYRFFQSKKRIGSLVYFVSLMLSLGAVLLTYSRSSQLALLIGIATFFYIKGNRKAILFAVSAIFLVGLLLFLFTGKRSEGTNMLRVVSSEARIGNMQDALIVWKDNPIFGVGFDAYRYAQHKHGIYGNNWEEGHGGAGADNSFLFVLATTGIIGLITYLFLFWNLFKGQKNTIHRSLRFATIIALSIGSFFVNGLFYPSLMLWLWTIMGITENR